MPPVILFSRLNLLSCQLPCSVSLKYGLENTGSAEAKPENVPCLGGIGGTGIPEIRPVGLT